MQNGIPDRIMDTLMNDFFENNEITIKDSNKAFEEFSTYYIISKIMDGDFTYDNIDEMQIGNSNDAGIDAIGILINGDFFDSLESLKDMFSANTNKNLDARIIFVQSKTSQKFKSSEMRTFGDGIVDCLRKEPRKIYNPRIKEKWAMINEIIRNVSSFSSITGRAYYATLGRWNGEDNNLTSTIKDIEESVNNMTIFNTFSFNAIDSPTLRQYVADSNTKVAQTIELPSKVVLPKVHGVDQGWYGYIQETEFIKLIVDENEDLRRSLFYDNVRDFQGETPANIGIANTLTSSTPENMSILNNGITIIADSAKQIRESITLENYQIVNGCQTSYVIYNQRQLAKENVYIPIKIIVTTSSDVSTNITIANNRQTAVKDEALLALTEVQKELEEFFNTYNGDKRLYYERRSNQYHSNPNVEKVRIVPIPISLRSYCSMFMYAPHIASRWYGKLYNDYSDKVFDGTKANITFYTSAFALYRYNFFIRNGIFERKYGKFKYFVLLMIRYSLTGNFQIPASKKEAERECNEINKVLWNKEKCKDIMKNMIEIIDKVAGDDITSTGLTANKSFLERVLAEIPKLQKSK
ncbi:AIPR family protein [Pediococcus pentosaceus]|uniref:AIPR family protein n=1 Tax=Pediococcus pentosaceus TaxID=1255 RepID=UPI001914510A|nr:AIPR family protein [Pediococcus pentosaceus]